MPTLQIRTHPPGPRARAFLKRSDRYVAPSATQAYPLVVDRAAGCHVWDVDGNCYLDFTAGIAVSAAGHGHKEVVGAITAQAGRLIHFSFADFYYPSYIRLAERLARMAPGRGAEPGLSVQFRRGGSRGGRKACAPCHPTSLHPGLLQRLSWTDAGRRVADLEQTGSAPRFLAALARRFSRPLPVPLSQPGPRTRGGNA